MLDAKCIHSCIHTCIHAYKQTKKQTWNTHMHAYRHAYMRTNRQTNKHGIHTNMRAFIYTCMNTDMHICRVTYIHACNDIYTCMQPYMHIHTYKHTNIQQTLCTLFFNLLFLVLVLFGLTHFFFPFFSNSTDARQMGVHCVVCCGAVYISPK